MTAVKNDRGKAPMHLIPPDALVEIAQVMGFGATKYGTMNYLKGTDWSRFVAAAGRHIAAWLSGEDTDQETTLNHLSHAICCILILWVYQTHGLGNDDRYGTLMKKLQSTHENMQ